MGKEGRGRANAMSIIRLQVQAGIEASNVFIAVEHQRRPVLDAEEAAFADALCAEPEVKPIGLGAREPDPTDLEERQHERGELVAHRDAGEGDIDVGACSPDGERRAAHAVTGLVVPAGLVVMADDKAVQPVYQPAPLVRADVLAEYPRIPEVLNPIFQGFDLETLQELNARIQVGGEPAAAVAEDYLTRKGLIE